MALREVFFLTDDPFDPSGVDPETGFNFRERQASLAEDLDLFTNGELIRYYSKVGSFGTAATNAEQGLAASKYSRGRRPPVVLISAAGGQGSSSLATFVARAVRDLAPDPGPTLHYQLVVSDHLGKALWLIARRLLTHLRAANNPIADQLDDGLKGIKPEDPDETTLLPLLYGLSKQAKKAPPLLVILEKVTYARRGWPAQLYGSLGGFNVMFICLTEDTRVPVIFRQDLRAGKVDGFVLALEGLTLPEALAFLQERLGLFRLRGAPADRQGLYPFLESEVHRAFVEADRLTIDFLLQILQETFGKKLDEIAAAGGKVTDGGADVMDGYRSAINKVGASAKDTGGTGR